MHIIIFIITGFIAGLILGMLGSGSSLIILPVLCGLFTKSFGSGFAMHVAVSTSMACLFIGSLITLFFKLKNDRIENWRVFAIIILASIAGVIIATVIGPFIPAHILKIYVGIFVLLAGLQMLFRKPLQVQTFPKLNFYLVFFVCLLIAILSGVAGLALGILMVPFLNQIKVPLSKAIIFSVVATVFYTLVGTLGFVIHGLTLHNLPENTFGLIYWPAFVIISIGSIAMIPVGVYLSKQISLRALQISFAVFILIAALNLLIPH